MLSAKTFGLWIAACGAIVAMGIATDARAEDEFDVKVTGDKIEVTAKGEWHVNKDYPWKIKTTTATLEKTKFSFSEKSATITGAPKGKVTLKGGVCSGDKCKNFEKELSI